jgi:hypothetical protein
LAYAHAAPAAEPEPKVVAFIGKLVSIKELPDQCPDTDKPKESPQGLESLCIQFDSLYEARYEVVEILSGEIRSKDVTFNIADHYGFPRFADYQHALLFVDIGPAENWLEKYQGYAVHRTSTSSWASCGNPYDERKGDTPRQLRPISFAKDFGTVGEFSSDGIARRFFDSKEMVVDGGRITCRNGVYASDLYDMVRTGVMSARGIRLPALEVRRNDL